MILTAITTILGLIPLSTGWSFDFKTFEMVIGGEGSQWWGPMGVAVIFGLAVATFLTLIIVPVLYSVLTGFAEWVAALFGRLLHGDEDEELPPRREAAME